MPLYDFKCSLCDKTREVIQWFEDKPPECCGMPMQRLHGSIAFIRIKDDIQGSTPGIRQKAWEITKKHRRSV